MNQIPRDYELVIQVDPRFVMDDLDNEDDIALLDKTDEVTRDHIMTLQRSAKDFGLKINMEKTKIMAYPPLGISRWLMVEAGAGS